MLRLADLLAPPACALCLSGRLPLCGRCLASMPLLTGPVCARCGEPTDVPVRECRACRGRRTVFETARAAVDYSGTGRDLVHRFKDGGLRGLAANAAALVVVVVPRPQRGVLTWVPADRWRLIRRGYHPPQLLAQELGRRWGLECLPLLEPTHRRRPQRGLDPAARRANVRGGFRVIGRPPSHVLLVDDVHTTGSTLSACCTALRAAGADRVDCITLARASPYR
jgi:predicted amidophosphoribosyltransferase